ncbi:ArsA-related P-loop ATPase [Kitasatospora gansuensis]
MRTILVSGDGAEEVAAATALHHARQGLTTHLLAADDPHRVLDDVLGTRLTDQAVRYADALTVARTDGPSAFRAAIDGLSGVLGPAFDLLGATPLDPEELTPLPGTGQLALLRSLRTVRDQVLVVAAPRPAELIAALALPEQLDRYLARLLPEQRQAARALRPLLAAVAGVPMPAEWLFEARTRAAAALAEARAVIEAPGTTVRLVVQAAAPARPSCAGSGPVSPCTACGWTRWSPTGRCPPPRPAPPTPGWPHTPSASGTPWPSWRPNWTSRC